MRVVQALVSSPVATVRTLYRPFCDHFTFGLCRTYMYGIACARRAMECVVYCSAFLDSLTEPVNALLVTKLMLSRFVKGMKLYLHQLPLEDFNTRVFCL